MEIIGGARPVARDGLRLHSDSPFLHTYYIEVRVTFLKEFQVFGKIQPKLWNTGSSFADFNHGLVGRPQGCHGCQKIHKNILQINLLEFFDKFHLNLNNVKKH